MKYLSLLFVLCLIAGSCSKDRDNKPVPTPTPNPNPTNTDSNAMKYTINGITDVTLDQEEEKFLVLGITHTGGKQEKLTLSVVDLPANVSATFETPSGIPSFGTKLTLKSNKPVGGTYAIKIKGLTESDSVKLLSMNLVIKAAPPPPPPPNPLGCVDSVTGTFNSDYNGTPGVQCTIVSYSVKNKVKITGLDEFPDPVILELDCTNKSIMQGQKQTLGNKEITINGGFFSNKTIGLDYVVVDLVTSVLSPRIVQLKP